MEKHFKKFSKWYAAALLVFVLSYFLFRPEMDSFFGIKPKGTEDEPEKDPVQAQKLEAKINKQLQLKRGSRGPEVQALQIRLNRDGAKPLLETDGIFGIKTLSALRQVVGSPTESVTLAFYDSGAWSKIISPGKPATAIDWTDVDGLLADMETDEVIDHFAHVS